MKHPLFIGTALLTVSGLLCRFIGFFYRVFLSRTIGAEGMGIYQLVLPIYHLCYAVCVAGIQTSLSRLIAAYTAKKEHTQANRTFLIGTVLSFTFSVCVSFFLQKASAFLVCHFLGDVRCLPLIKWLAFALPFGALHGCITGWYMGKKQVLIPAGIQLAEECIRFLVTYLCCKQFLFYHFETAPEIAVIGLFASEAVSVVISLFFIRSAHLAIKKPLQISNLFFAAKELLIQAFPLMTNRVVLNLMHSIEAFLIPYTLQTFGMSQKIALETLGIITGMALPLVLFPTAIINALSTILLPTISENQALNEYPIIRKLVQKAGLFSIFIGLFCVICFSIFGSTLGSLFYKNEIVGIFIPILSIISPFLFINIILASVMNGVGKTHLCFMVNLLNMCIRLCCIYFLVPKLGINGYITGLIGGEIFCTFISIIIIYRLIFVQNTMQRKTLSTNV